MKSPKKHQHCENHRSYHVNMIHHIWFSSSVLSNYAVFMVDICSAPCLAPFSIQCSEFCIDSFDQNVTLVKSNMTVYCVWTLDMQWGQSRILKMYLILKYIDKFEAVLTLNNVVIHHRLSTPCQMTCYILHTNMFVYTTFIYVCIYISFLSLMLVHNFYAAFTRSATVDMI